jgi:hypothetical protein
MKFLLVLLVISSLTVGTINAQPPEVKLEVNANISGQGIPCTGDIMAPGSIVTCEIMVTPNNTIVSLRDATVIGLPSGKEYELFQTLTSHEGGNFVNHLQARCDGKLIAVVQVVFHITTNANGEVTADFNHLEVSCK